MRITALTDFVGAITQKHLIALAAISVILAAVMEITAREQTRPLIIVLSACTVAVPVLTLPFLVFASWNTVMVPRYGSSDLFLSVLLVIIGFSLWTLAMSILSDPQLFHPVPFILAGVVSLAFSAMFATLLPLAHKVYSWISGP